MLAKFSRFQGTLKATRPMMATGILFSDPTKLYLVAVVVDRNHRDAKLILKATCNQCVSSVQHALQSLSWIHLHDCVSQSCPQAACFGAVNDAIKERKPSIISHPCPCELIHSRVRPALWPRIHGQFKLAC